MDEFKQIINVLSKLQGFYDSFKIIDEKDKKIVMRKDNSYSKGILNSKSHYNDLTFLKILEKKQTVVEIKYDKDNTFMIITSPIRVKEKTYIMEIIKNISKCGFITNMDNGSCYDISKEIDKINKCLIIDESTGIYNKRYLKKRLPLDIRCNLINNTNLAIMMIDIDDFKKINDKYGHVIGDRLLKKFANLIYKNVRRQKDWVARYGGEEFLVVINNIQKEKAYKIAENIRQVIENKIFICKEFKIKITASLGIKFITHIYDDIFKAIDEADKSLYIAKSQGKNKCIMAK